MDSLKLLSDAKFLGKAKEKRLQSGAVDKNNGLPSDEGSSEFNCHIKDAKDLGRFLERLRDDLRARKLAGIFVMTALNDCMLRFKATDYFTDANKNVVREIWEELTKFGFQTNRPNFL
ncbi:MAG TPA: hypothetical protein PKD37_06180 [Oligoflexia bacterium]|nr:hypothetical protein [Oligoflexia bacterium]HMP27549.1 hypothetical protein [Oligoflexia bacterium]